MKSLVRLCIVLGLSLAAAMAQTSAGAVDGVVQDATGAVVPGVQVTLRNVETGDRRTSVTSAQGQFVFPSVAPGSYEVVAEAPGFKKTVQSKVVVEVQQTTRVDLMMEVGDVAETLEVKAKIPLLQPSTSSLGQVVDNQKILDLPMGKRKR